ncbi:tyrosine-protein phosphatase [Trinickia violacea]|uniref:Tyrosine-protein phosphatase n=1 Tax=Trinickia violacea TaxID=2571746 RepID=A0A4P8ISX9_9BURK|nr:tyrosine-protein phosphatase [Trinickia violacea]QCP50393.1 tyrosine-protein phosphatase [Trinickia violacea]
MTAIERHIELEGSSNLRDIGGYPACDGRQVRWGMVYRSGAMYRFTDSAWRWMAERGVRVVCDLRSSEERELSPTNWQGGDHTRHVGIAYGAKLLLAELQESGEAGVNEMHNSLYCIFPKLLAPSFKAMFEALLEQQTPLVVHCSAGQDRTGLAIGLLLSALGVPRDTVVADYRLSTQCRRVENEINLDELIAASERNAFARFYAQVLKRRGKAALRPRDLVNRNGQPLLFDAFNAIDAQWGSLAAYLEAELNLRHEDLARLRELCLTDASAQ